MHRLRGPKRKSPLLHAAWSCRRRRPLVEGGRPGARGPPHSVGGIGTARCIRHGAVNRYGTVQSAWRGEGMANRAGACSWHGAGRTWQTERYRGFEQSARRVGQAGAARPPGSQAGTEPPTPERSIEHRTDRPSRGPGARRKRRSTTRDSCLEPWQRCRQRNWRPSTPLLVPPFGWCGAPRTQLATPALDCPRVRHATRSTISTEQTPGAPVTLIRPAPERTRRLEAALCAPCRHNPIDTTRLPPSCTQWSTPKGMVVPTHREHWVQGWLPLTTMLLHPPACRSAPARHTSHSDFARAVEHCQRREAESPAATSGCDNAPPADRDHRSPTTLGVSAPPSRSKGKPYLNIWVPNGREMCVSNFRAYTLWEGLVVFGRTCWFGSPPQEGVRGDESGEHVRREAGRNAARSRRMFLPCS